MRREDHTTRGRDGRDAATSLGSPRAAGRHQRLGEKPGTLSPSETPKEQPHPTPCPHRHPDLGHLTPELGAGFCHLRHLACDPLVGQPSEATAEG